MNYMTYAKLNMIVYIFIFIYVNRDCKINLHTKRHRQLVIFSEMLALVSSISIPNRQISAVFLEAKV